MAIQVDINVHASQTIELWRQIYRFFGADEINYVYMKDGKKLLAKLGALGDHQVFFRVHGQFVTGEGIHALKWGSTDIYTETDKGEPIYNWTIIDKVFDTYMENNVKPYVQFGFMPEAMSTKPQPYQHKWTATAPYHEIFTGWAYPPKDYRKWGELVYEWTKHCIERYGKVECESWYWETWNEPDIGYWQGTPEEFYMLYDYATEGVRRALPTARVGGPETTGRSPEYLKGFLEHCISGENKATKGTGSDLDFLSFHAKGSPVYMDKTQSVRMDLNHQLRQINDSMEVIASFPQFKDKPIVLGESDPEGAAAAQGPQLAYRNGTLYSSYTAASFARKHELSRKHGVNLEGALTWAFEFEDQPYFAGFRVLASNNIDLPVLNVFRMFAKMQGDLLSSTSSHQIPLEHILKDSVRTDPDIGAIATRDGATVAVMVWHYHDDDLAGDHASVKLRLENLECENPADAVTHYRIDGTHSNAYTKWRDIGSPQKPTAEQLREMEDAGNLAVYGGKTSVEQERKDVVVSFDLPRQGVSLLVVKAKG